MGVYYTKTRPGLYSIIKKACNKAKIAAFTPNKLPLPLSAIIENQALERSDIRAFELKKIPTIFFSSGEHDDYHRPTDTANKIDPKILATRAKAIYLVVKYLSNISKKKLRIK